MPVRPPARTRVVLAARDFRYYLIGQTTSSFGNALSSLALAFGVLSLTRSASVLGGVLLASRLPAIALTLLGGVVGDRFSRRLVMLATDSGRALLQGTTALLLLSGQARVWSLALLQVGSGIGTAMFNPAAGGLVANLAPPGRIREANSLLSMSSSLAGIAGIGAAGAAVAAIGPGAAFALDAATFAASAASLAMIRSGSLAVPVHGRAALLEQAREGWRAVRARGWLLAYAGHVALLNTVALSPFFVLGPLVAERHLGGAGAWAAIGAAYGGGGLAGGGLLLRVEPARPMVTAFALSLLLAPLLVLLAIPAPLAALVPAALLAGAQGTAYNTLATATVQSDTPDRLRSRVSAVVSVGGLAGVPIGMALAGLGAQSLGSTAVLATGGAWVVLSGVLALAVPSVRRVRVVREPPGGETGG